jgi:hypothetical protein
MAILQKPLKRALPIVSRGSYHIFPILSRRISFDIHAESWVQFLADRSGAKMDRQNEERAIAP